MQSFAGWHKKGEKRMNKLKALIKFSLSANFTWNAFFNAALCFHRFMGEYTDYPADYAEVSSSFQSGQQSPAPYATTTLIGSSKLAPSDAQRFNMFYRTEIYPPSAAGVPNNNNNNYNRSVHSESYCNQNGNNSKMNIVENRMANTMTPNMFNQQQQNSARNGTNKRNRLKLMNPQNFRINFGSQGEQLYVKVGDINAQGQASSTPQSQNGSINWSTQNFNIYENQMHNHADGATASNHPDKEYIYSGNRSIMSYMSSKDFPENV